MRLHRYNAGLLLALLLLLTPALAPGGTTGKITGRATDKNSREALVGVNVIVEGTTLGGTSDANGMYTILNVPPGTHRIRASLVGYSPLVVNDVRVFIDQTSPASWDGPCRRRASTMTPQPTPVPRVMPFRGVRYNPALVPDITRVVAPVDQR